MADKEKSFRKGDIVRNIYAGKTNPERYLLYIGKCTIRQGRYTSNGYLCRNWEGEKVEFFQKDNPLEYMGHMDAFDEFMAALKKLKDMEHGEVKEDENTEVHQR